MVSYEESQFARAHTNGSREQQKEERDKREVHIGARPKSIYMHKKKCPLSPE